MANKDNSWYEPDDYDLPEFITSGQSGFEPLLFLDMVDGNKHIAEDPIMQLAFHEAFFDWDLTPAEKENAREALAIYMEQQYDLDFDDVFDWEEYRDWYGTD